MGLANFFMKRMLFSIEFVSRLAVALDPAFQALDKIANGLTFLVYLQINKQNLSIQADYCSLQNILLQ